MTARFERDVSRGTGGVTRLEEGHNFSMRLPRGLCETGADLLVIAN
jgi:hypothetical protein